MVVGVKSVKINLLEGSMANSPTPNVRDFTEGDKEIVKTVKSFLKLEVESDGSKIEITGIRQERVRCRESGDKFLRG